MVYRELNSGGSFGCSPLRQSIGIGKATIIEEIKIEWPASKIVQIFKNIAPNQFLKLTENRNEFELMNLRSFKYKSGAMEHHMH